MYSWKRVNLHLAAPQRVDTTHKRPNTRPHIIVRMSRRGRGGIGVLIVKGDLET